MVPNFETFDKRVTFVERVLTKRPGFVLTLILFVEGFRLHPGSSPPRHDVVLKTKCTSGLPDFSWCNIPK
jgi:hypothetical protein